MRPPQPIDPADPPWLHKTGRALHRVRHAVEVRKVRRAQHRRQPLACGRRRFVDAARRPRRHHHAERTAFRTHHDGVPDIDPAVHRLVIHGLVRRPLMFTVENLLRYPMRSPSYSSSAAATAMPDGTRSRSSVLSANFTASCRARNGPACRFPFFSRRRASIAGVVGHRRGCRCGLLNVSLPLSKLMDDAMSASIRTANASGRNGYPIRLCAGLGRHHERQVVAPSRTYRPPSMTRNETAKYTELLPSGKARMFTFVMDAKSLITSPSPGQTMHGPKVTKFAGSPGAAAGASAKVEVSADAGKSWARQICRDR